MEFETINHQNKEITPYEDDYDSFDRMKDEDHDLDTPVDDELSRLDIIDGSNDDSSDRREDDFLEDDILDNELSRLDIIKSEYVDMLTTLIMNRYANSELQVIDNKHCLTLSPGSSFECICEGATVPLPISNSNESRSHSMDIGDDSHEYDTVALYDKIHHTKCIKKNSCVLVKLTDSILVNEENFHNNSIKKVVRCLLKSHTWLMILLGRE